MNKFITTKKQLCEAYANTVREQKFLLDFKRIKPNEYSACVAALDLMLDYLGMKYDPASQTVKTKQRKKRNDTGKPHVWKKTGTEKD